MDDRVELLIVGGGVAAARAARTLRRRGFDGSILLVGDDPLPPYNRPPLSKELLLHDEPLPDDLLLAEPVAWYDRRAIDLRTDVAVISLDPGERLAGLSDGGIVRYERCLLATGAAPHRLPVPGADHAMLLRTAVDARRLRVAMDANPGAEVVVVGGGFIGLEVASALAVRGLHPTVVELGDVLWGGQLGSGLADWARDRLAAAGVSLRLGSAVTAVDADAAWVGDERLPAAFVVAGVGVAPRDELARAAGLAVDDGVVVDGAGRTSEPAIWAAGDVARIDGLRVEHWHAAREAGERAALSILGEAVPPVAVPWVFSELAGVTVDVFGIPAADDEARWLVPERLLAYRRRGRLVGLVGLGGAIAPETGRELVARGASEADVRGALAG
ncbi:MAG TPA: FAD-dependent oxidoreductase [Candidatus Limnocylindria bacterium]|nr:FAD-dependent oxidoreductase [Candidatus Limnocylindria bacterium]